MGINAYMKMAGWGLGAGLRSAKSFIKGTWKVGKVVVNPHGRTAKAMGVDKNMANLIQWGWMAPAAMRAFGVVNDVDQGIDVAKSQGGETQTTSENFDQAKLNAASTVLLSASAFLGPLGIPLRVLGTAVGLTRDSHNEIMKTTNGVGSPIDIGIGNKRLFTRINDDGMRVSRLASDWEMPWLGGETLLSHYVQKDKETGFYNPFNFPEIHDRSIRNRRKDKQRIDYHGNPISNA